MITQLNATALFSLMLLLAGCASVDSSGSARRVCGANGEDASEDVEYVRVYVLEKTRNLGQVARKIQDDDVEVLRVSYVPDRGQPYVFVVSRSAQKIFRLDFAYESDGRLVNAGGQLSDAQTARILNGVFVIKAEGVPKFRGVSVLGGELWFARVPATDDANGGVVHLVRWSPMLDDEYSSDEKSGVLDVIRCVRDIAIPLGLPSEVHSPERWTRSGNATK